MPLRKSPVPSALVCLFLTSEPTIRTNNAIFNVSSTAFSTRISRFPSLFLVEQVDHSFRQSLTVRDDSSHDNRFVFYPHSRISNSRVDNGNRTLSTHFAETAPDDFSMASPNNSLRHSYVHAELRQSTIHVNWFDVSRSIACNVLDRNRIGDQNRSRRRE